MPARLQRSPRGLLLLLCCVTLPLLLAAAGVSLREELERASGLGHVPPDLEVVYTAVHPLYGGTILEIHGDGLGLRTTRQRGGQHAEIRQTQVSHEDLVRLVDLLFEQRAWEQRVPERQAVPDEGKASLEIRLGGTEGGFWEWYNDMGESDRLLRISVLMGELVPR